MTVRTCVSFVFGLLVGGLLFALYLHRLVPAYVPPIGSFSATFLVMNVWPR